MHMRAAAIAVLILSVCFSSCSSDGLPNYFQLGGLRVLALKSDAPEIAPGATVTITPLISDLNAGARTLNYVAKACVDPGISVGATPSCDTDPAAVTQSGSFVLSGNRYTGAAPAFSVTVPATLLALSSDAEKFNGKSYLVLYTVSVGTESTTAFRRIVGSTKATKNANPVIGGARIDGAAISELPSSEKELEPVITSGAESYLFQNTDGATQTLEETLTVSWFISQGDLEYSRTDGATKNKYTPSAAPDGTKPVFLVLVLRDDRGGVDWIGVPSL